LRENLFVIGLPPSFRAFASFVCFAGDLFQLFSFSAFQLFRTGRDIALRTSGATVDDRDRSPGPPPPPLPMRFFFACFAGNSSPLSAFQSFSLSAF
jgi:hypothetical protein